MNARSPATARREIADSTMVLTPTAWRPAAAMSSGEALRGAGGRVFLLASITKRSGRPQYLVRFSDGASAIAGPDHSWTTQTHNDRTYEKADGRARWRTVSTLQVMDLLRRGDARATYVPMVSPVEYMEAVDLPLDPYGLGLLLGDGSFRLGTPTFTKPEPELHRALAAAFPDNQIHIVGDQARGAISIPSAGGPNRLTRELRELGLWGQESSQKFVPPPYLLAAPTERLALLQGLLDTDGWVQSNATGNTSAYYSTSSGRLTEGVVELVESLGGTTTVHHRARPKHQGGIGRPAWVVGVRLPRDNEPFRLHRKLAAWLAGQTTKATRPVRRITSVEYLGVGVSVDLGVDNPSDHLVLSRFIVT